MSENMGINMNMSCVCNDGKWTIGFHTEDSDGHDINIELNDIDDIEDCFDILLDEVIEALTEPEEEYNDWDDVEDIDDYIVEILEENRALREEVEELRAKLQPTEDKCACVCDYGYDSDMGAYNFSIDADEVSHIMNQILSAFGKNAR